MCMAHESTKLACKYPPAAATLLSPPPGIVMLFASAKSYNAPWLVPAYTTHVKSNDAEKEVGKQTANVTPRALLSLVHPTGTNVAL